MKPSSECSSRKEVTIDASLGLSVHYLRKIKETNFNLPKVSKFGHLKSGVKSLWTDESWISRGQLTRFWVTRKVRADHSKKKTKKIYINEKYKNVTLRSARRHGWIFLETILRTF